MTPTTEDTSRFTREGNEAFGACMTLWNQHRWEEARAAMIRFSAAFPDDPWRGESDLHIACYHKFRGEHTEAEENLVRLYEQNKDNPIGRKALVRLSRVYYDTHRFQAAYEVLHTLLQMNPTDNETSYALNWLFHVSRSWMYAAQSRECGPKAFGFAAWLYDNRDQIRQERTAQKARRERLYPQGAHRAYLPALSFERMADAYPWAREKGNARGLSLAQMRGLLEPNGLDMETRHVSCEEMIAYASEDRPVVLCMPAPSTPLFQPDEALAAAVEKRVSSLEHFADGRESADLGHYMVLVKANERVAWLLDPENGLIQKSQAALKDMWLRGEDRGLAVFVSRQSESARTITPEGNAVPRSEARIFPGVSVDSAAEAAFFGGCCGYEPSNDDTGCPEDGGPGLNRGMPGHSVNVLNLNYLVTDTPIWIKTPGASDLNLTLTYNNREAYSAKYPIDDVQFYPFGYRWSAPYDGIYTLDPGTNILVRFPNGMEVYFDEQQDETYLPRDSRYFDHFDLTVLNDPEGVIRVDLKNGLKRYYFHSLNELEYQQTLYRIENQFGDGIDITRDAGGRIIKVQSDVTGSSLNYEYNLNGNVIGVYEKDGAGVPTVREAVFSYQEVGGGNARLASITDMGGYTTTFEYGPQSYVVSGQTVTSDHHIVSYKWPNNGEWTFDLQQTFYTGHNEPLRLEISDPEGKSTIYNYYAFDPTGPVGKEDRNEASWFWGLDSVQGNVMGRYATLVNDRQGGVFTRQGEYVDYREFSSTGKRELVFERTVAEPVTGTEGYDDSYNLYRTSNAARRDATYTYTTQTNGNRIITIDTEVHEDVEGIVSKTDEWTEEIEEDEFGDVVRMTDRAGDTVFFDRTAGRLIESIRIQPENETDQTTWQATYNARGQMLSRTVDEGLLNLIEYEYDAIGRRIGITHPDGTSETFGYDESTHLLTNYTDRTGQSIEIEKDAMGRPLRVIFADQTEVSYTYGCCGPDSVEDRFGVIANFAYDGNKRLLSSVMPMNPQTDTCVEYAYMGEGELKSLGYGPSFEDLAVRSFDYIVDNGITRLAARKTPNNKTPAQWEYEFTGLPTQKTDGRGVTNTFHWNVPKQLLNGVEVQGAAAGLGNRTVEYTYDDRDRLAVSALTAEGLGEIRTETRQYDNRSRVVQADVVIGNLPGQNGTLEYTLSYDYNARGLLANRTLSVNGSAIIPTAYTYDPDSPRLTRVADSYAVGEYTYDAFGRLSTLTRKTPANATVTTQEWSYDAQSRLDSLTHSNSTSLLWGAQYGYEIDRIETIEHLHDNGTWTYATDYQGQLTQALLRDGNGAPAFFERYAYDAVGNIEVRYGMEGDTEIDPNADDEISTLTRHATVTLVGLADTNATVSLPLNSEIVVEQEPDGVWVAPRVPLPEVPASTFSASIQLKAEKDGELPRYQLASFSVEQFDGPLLYDENGCLLTHKQAEPNLAWDAEGRLGSVTQGESEEQYFYDEAGRRIAKIIDGELTLYIWDGMDILAVTDGNGNVLEYYTRGLGIAGDVGTLIAQRDMPGNQTVFLHNNHRGDVVLATDEAGALLGRYEYTPFGNPLSFEGAFTPRFGFSSKERDASGLVYFGFRYYSPLLARWLSPDPIGEDGGLNLYRFCGNNPVIAVDPEGTSGIIVPIIAVIIGIGTIWGLWKIGKMIDEAWEELYHNPFDPSREVCDHEDAIQRQKRIAEDLKKLQKSSQEIAEETTGLLNPLPSP